MKIFMYHCMLYENIHVSMYHCMFMFEAVSRSKKFNEYLVYCSVLTDEES